MQKMVLIFLTAFIATISVGQDAEELNNRSKEFLGQQDFKSAVPLMRQAAEKGIAEAQYNYGLCFQQGIEVLQNDSIANTWFLAAAKQGYKNAQFKIAYSFARGRGVTKNDELAFHWSVQCAWQHDVDCMFNVVSGYMNGQGVQQNFDSMLAWGTRIALLETPEDLYISGKITSARANLALMYRNGQNISKDLVKSYLWFLIYNESKRDFSILEQQKNIEVIEALEKELTIVEKDRAHLEAEKILSRKLTNLARLHEQDL